MSGSAFDLLAQPIQHALWDLQWRELRPIQVDAIRTLLASDSDLLITARTASGKTEAAFLPILSALVQQPGDSVGAMYVGPLKALINDQFQRLERLCERAEIPVHRWHGDVDAGKKEKLLKNPRGIILITPESLESFFVNRPSRLAPLFGDLRYVVIDEIHALVGRERGLQLRSQLFRLRRYTRSDFRLLGLSATVGDQIDSYRRWMRPGDPARVAHIFDSAEQKRVQFGIQAYELTQPDATTASRPDDDIDGSRRLHELEAPVPQEMVADTLKRFGGTKNLIFCNNRGGVEWLADALNDACRRAARPEEFLVHHGSVSKELREFAEEQMRSVRPSTAVCSATLELGIDIGNVRTVGQLGPCWSVNSQVQRLGRSGRRDDEPHCMRVMLPLRKKAGDASLVERLYPELLQAVAVTELMLERWVEPPGMSDHDRSTLVQQILSVLAEVGGIAPKRLGDRLLVEGAFHNVDVESFADVLRSLGRRNLIEQMQDGLLLLTPKGEQLVHDRDFYSAFVTPQELTVRFDGRTIGSLSALYMPRPDDHFLLAGRRWQVLQLDVDRSEIIVRQASGRKPPKFFGSVGDIHPRIRDEMWRVLCDDAQYAYLDDVAQGILQEARTASRAANPNHESIIDVGPHSCLWFTWTGTAIQRTLLLIAEHVGLDCFDERIAIRCEAPATEVVRRLVSFVDANKDDFEIDFEAVPWRKFDDYLSQELLQESFVHDRLDISGACKLITKFREARRGGTLAASVSLQLEDDQAECDYEGEIEITTQSDVTRRLTDLFSSAELSECEFVAFDVETTGLHPIWSKIVEIGAIRFRLDGEISRFHTLVDPEAPIPEAAERIHGITDAMVQGKPTICQALNQLNEFLGSTPTLLLAHNAYFDQSFISAAASRYGLSLPGFPIADTLSLGRSLIFGAPDYRLSTLNDYLALPGANSHRALADAEMVQSLFRHLVGMKQFKAIQDLGQFSEISWLSDSSPETSVVPDGFEELASAIENRRPVQMLYRGGRLQPALRQIIPISIIAVGGRHYLSAICGFDGETKSFRLDRILKLNVVEKSS